MLEKIDYLKCFFISVQNKPSFKRFYFFAVDTQNIDTTSSKVNAR